MIWRLGTGALEFNSRSTALMAAAWAAQAARSTRDLAPVWVSADMKPASRSSSPTA
jgi:hypothetical protein